MSTIDNYPPGAKNDPRAPFNEHEENNEEDFVIYPMVTLTGESSFSSDDYDGGYRDEMGEYVPKVYYGSSSDMVELWKKQHYTPLELIHQYKELLMSQLHFASDDEVEEIQRKIDDCSIWTEEIADNN